MNSNLSQSHNELSEGNIKTMLNISNILWYNLCIIKMVIRRGYWIALFYTEERGLFYVIFTRKELVKYIA